MHLGRTEVLIIGALFEFLETPNIITITKNVIVFLASKYAWDIRYSPISQPKGCVSQHITWVL